MADAGVINNSINIIELISRDTNLKKVASTGGGEWAGACPFCGGEDRFRVQEQAPAGKKPQGQRWWCRECSPKWGDVIGYVMKRDNVEFLEAIDRLAPGVNDTPAKKHTPAEAPKVDRAKWVDTAFEFLEDCVNHLWGDEGKGAREYLYWRCLDDETLHQWAIGYNPTEGFGNPADWGLAPDAKIWIPKGIVIPCQDAAGLHYVKIRRRSDDPKYFILKGGESWAYGLSTYLDRTTAFLFEGEFDVMLAYQSGLTGLGYASIPAGNDLDKKYQPFFESIIDVIVAFDNDEPGRDGSEKLCKMPHFHKAGNLPIGKDFTEYIQAGGDGLEWLLQQLEIIQVDK